MTRRELLGSAAIVFAVPALVFVLFIATAWLSVRVGVDPESGRKRIATAFETGALGLEGHAAGDTIKGVHQFNDCLVLGMAIEKRDPDTLKLAISPQFPFADWTSTPCVLLRDFVTGKVQPGTPVSYHNYLHGHTVLARVLLRKFSLENIRLILAGTLTPVIMAVMGLAMFRLARGRDLWSNLTFLVTALCLARWFGLEAFGQSLGHAPADLIIALFVLFLCVVAQRGVSRMQLVLASTLFGCCTMIMEFLTGGLPLGLALVIGASPFVMKRETKPRELFVSTAMASAAFIAASGLTLALKFALAFAVFGAEMMSGVTEDLGMRMALSEAVGEPGAGIAAWGESVLNGISVLAGSAPAMWVLAAAGLILSGAGGVWGLLRVRGRSADETLRLQALLLAASNLVIVAWLLVFSQHTIVHAWFMDRIFVWTIASGTTLFAMGVIVSRASPSIDREPRLR